MYDLKCCMKYIVNICTLVNSLTRLRKVRHVEKLLSNKNVLK